MQIHVDNRYFLFKKKWPLKWNRIFAKFTNQFEVGKHLMIQQESSEKFCIREILISLTVKIKTNNAERRVVKYYETAYKVIFKACNSQTV